jgi:hypothetical protein
MMNGQNYGHTLRGTISVMTLFGLVIRIAPPVIQDKRARGGFHRQQALPALILAGEQYSRLSVEAGLIEGSIDVM